MEYIMEIINDTVFKLVYTAIKGNKRSCPVHKLRSALVNTVQYKKILRRVMELSINDAVFRAVYTVIRGEKRSCPVHKLRSVLIKDIGWTNAEVNQYIEQGMITGQLAGRYGDPSRLTKEQLNQSFQGSDGELYIALVMR